MWGYVGFVQSNFLVKWCDSMWNDSNVDNEWCCDPIRLFFATPHLFFITNIYETTNRFCLGFMYVSVCSFLLKLFSQAFFSHKFFLT